MRFLNLIEVCNIINVDLSIEAKNIIFRVFGLARVRTSEGILYDKKANETR